MSFRFDLGWGRIARRAPFWLRATVLSASALIGGAEVSGPTFTERVPELTAATADPASILDAWLAAGEPRQEREALRQALTVWRERQPESMGALLTAAEEAGAATRAELMAACGEVGDARAVPALLNALGQHDSLDEHVLTQLSRCGPLLPAAWSERAGRRLAPWTGNPEGSIAAGAVEALTALGCVDQVQTLVELLEDPRQIVREAAVRGLRTLTGRDEPGEAEPWQAWIEKEREFSRGPLLDQLDDLRFAPVPELADRLRALDGHGLLRDEIADGIARLLERPEGPVRELACRRLGASGSAAALEPLLHALEEEALREAAGAALEQLTARREADWASWAEACEAAR